jgi:alkylhydroperoxidase/carboxymuconolactone decarboxylase family protein YurZ
VVAEVAAVEARILLGINQAGVELVAKVIAAAVEITVGVVQQEILEVVAVLAVLAQTLTLLGVQLLEVLVVLEQPLLFQVLL